MQHSHVSKTESFFQYFSEADFMPHGHCYLWKPGLVYTHVISDLFIGLAYISISLSLYALVKKIKIPFSAMALSFGVFIGACGWTHFNEIWNLWYSDYWYSGMVKVLTAVASVSTGIWLYRLKPQIISVAEAAKASEGHLKSLEESEKTIRSFFDSATMLMGIVEVVHNNILHISDNKAAALFFGKKDPQETAGKFASELGMPQEIISYWIEQYKKAEMSGRPVVFEYIYGSDSSRTFYATVSFISKTLEENSRFSYIVQDITEQKLNQKLLKEAHDNLELKVEMATEQLKEAVKARDEFLSIASHELKTPLTSLSLITQSMEKLIKKNDPDAYSKLRVDRFIEQNSKHINRITRLVDDMLDISRIRIGKLHIEKYPFDLCELIQEVCDRLSQLFSHANVQLTIEKCESLNVNLDKFRIEQVITNLLSNAVKYGSGKPVTIKITKTGKTALISVHDEGPGIALENQRRIFRRFERAISANEVSGLGLGLYIAAEIVDAHEGKIWVESDIGKGSTFFVELPSLE